jgi:hypothetical protein
VRERRLGEGLVMREAWMERVGVVDLGLDLDLECERALTLLLVGDIVCKRMVKRVDGLVARVCDIVV